MSNYSFCGMESNGLLLKASIPAAKALALAGKPLRFRYTAADKQQVRCALLVVRIENLSTWGIPLIRWTYPEAVWMIELENDDYLAVKAHTPAYMLPALALMDKYNTDLGAMQLKKVADSAEVTLSAGASRFAARLSAAIACDEPLISNLWTRSRGGKYYRIPWGPNKPLSMFRMQCELPSIELARTVFGDNTVWDEQAVFFIDRKHDCAPAYADSPALAGV